MLRRMFLGKVLSSLGVLGIGIPATVFSAVDTPEVISKGWSKVELLKILADFEVSYQGDLGQQLGCTLDSLGSDEFDFREASARRSAPIWLTTSGTPGDSIFRDGRLQSWGV